MHVRAPPVCVGRCGHFGLVDRGRAAVPEEITTALMGARLTALEKPDGCEGHRNWKFFATIGGEDSGKAICI